MLGSRQDIRLIFLFRIWGQISFSCICRHITLNREYAFLKGRVSFLLPRSRALLQAVVKGSISDYCGRHNSIGPQSSWETTFFDQAPRNFE